MRFPYYNVEFRKNYLSDLLLVSGEIKNCSGRTYATAVFRIILYHKNKIMGSGMIKVCDFKARFTRSFEAVLELDYKIASRITNFDIVFESGY